MRKRVWALAAALLMLPLTGCGSLLNRDYSVTEPHSSSYYESEDRSVLRAESYQDLVNALLVLISGGAKEGTIWLYPDDSGLPAPQAAERACLEVQKETPAPPPAGREAHCRRGRARWFPPWPRR